MLSKRVLTELCAAAMSRAGTIRACRRSRACAGARVPAEAIRDFVKRIGVAKANSVVDVGMFEFAVRGAQPQRRASHGRAASAQGRDRELS
jgi:glutaminyl-tRNA synthetase